MNSLTLTVLVVPNIILLILIIVTDFRTKNKAYKQKNSLSVIDQLNHASKLSKLNTGYKMLLTLVLLVFCLINSNILVSIFIILLTTFITVYVGKIGLKQYLKLFIIPLSFLILSCLAIAVNFTDKLPSESIISVKLWTVFCFITKSSLLSSLVVFLRVLACVSVLYFLIVNTPVDRILAYLKRLHFPNILIELMFLIYRFIFYLWEITSEMIIAAKLRFGFTSYPKTIRTIGMIGSNIFIVSFKKAQKFYNSMESRLYNGSLNFIFIEPKITPVEILIMCFGTIYLIFLYYFFR